MEKEEIKNILSFSGKEARAFFLKSESYCNLELPEYIDVGKMVRNLFHDILHGQISLDAIKSPGCLPETLSDIKYALYASDTIFWAFYKNVDEKAHSVLYNASVLF